MSKRNPREQINRASWNLVEGIKDAVRANIAAAASRGAIDAKGDELSRLIELTTASVDEGYHKAARVFDRAVDEAMHQSVLAATMPPVGVPSPKKSRT